MKIFKLPDLGEGLQEAEIVEWHIQVGDEVAADQPMVSVETAKALVDMCNGLAKRYGSRFKPPKIWRDMAKTGETFYGRFPPEKRKAVA